MNLADAIMNYSEGIFGLAGKLNDFDLAATEAMGRYLGLVRYIVGDPAWLALCGILYVGCIIAGYRAIVRVLDLYHSVR